MKWEYKTSLIVIGILLLIFINFLCFWIGYQNFLDPKLGEFEILDIKKEQNFILEVSPCHHKVEYEVLVYKKEEKIYETTSEKEQIVLEGLESDYLDELKFVVKAKNKKGVEKESQNEYYYTYDDATFSKEQNHYLSETRDVTLNILGYQMGEDYIVELYYDKNKIYESPLDGSDITIPYQVIEGYSGKIEAVLKTNGRVSSHFNFYLNTPIVGKVKILNDREITSRWKSFDLLFQGGENAEHFYVNFYVNGVLEEKREVEVLENKIFLPNSFFQENTDYELELEAVYQDFFEIAEKDKILLHVGKKETTSGVYVSHNPNFIKKGTKVTLQTISDEATIYYTMDGTDPVQNGLVYDKPIEINKDMTIKTYAVSNSRNASFLSTYSFHVEEKTPVIYISPSNQDENYGVSGFTNEMAEMNKVADVVERELKNSGFIVYRNHSRGNINEWISESRRVGADFHLAIHSNASSHHTARGPEIYVNSENSLSYSIASQIYENLWKIYAGNKDITHHRGVKFSRGALGEANDEFLPCGSLIEVAYHDEEHDAMWIVQNIENIGKNIAHSIVTYYG